MFFFFKKFIWRFPNIFRFFSNFQFLTKIYPKNIGFWSIPKCKLGITKFCFLQKKVKHFFVERRSSKKLKNEVLALNLHRLTNRVTLKVKLYRNGAISQHIWTYFSKWSFNNKGISDRVEWRSSGTGSGSVECLGFTSFWNWNDQLFSEIENSTGKILSLLHERAAFDWWRPFVAATRPTRLLLWCHAMSCQVFGTALL